MGTIKLVEPNMIDINDINQFIDNENIKNSNIFDYQLLSIDNYSEWLSIVNNPKLQIKKFYNIFNFYLAKRIEDDTLVGFVLIKRNLDLNNIIPDSQIKYFISNNERHKGYGSQILNQAINTAKKLKLDQVIISLPKDNIASNKLIVDRGGILNKQISFNNQLINRFIVKFI